MLVLQFYIIILILQQGMSFADLKNRVELSSVFISSIESRLEEESKIVSAIEMVKTITQYSAGFMTNLEQEYSPDILGNISDSINLHLEDLVLKLGFEQEFECSGETAIFSESGLEAPAQNITEQLTREDSEDIPGVYEPCHHIDQRLTGTDLSGGRIAEIQVQTPEQCQGECVEAPDCNYFLFFSMNHYQPWKRGTCRLLALKGEYEPAPGHISGPRNCSTSAKTLSFKTNLIEMLKTTLRNVLSIECRRRTMFASRINNLEILLDSLLEVYCSELSLSPETEAGEWTSRLKRGIEKLMRSQGLEEKDFIPEYQPWQQDKLEMFTETFISKCEPIRDQLQEKI